MESYNKALITVSLAFIVAIVSIELVIAGFLGKYVTLILELLFGDVVVNIDSKLVLRLKAAIGLFFAFLLIFWVFVCILFKGIFGVKYEGYNANLQSSKNHDELISSINNCAVAVKDCAESCKNVSNQIGRLCDLVASNDSVRNSNNRSTDNCSYNSAAVNNACKGKESSNSVSVNADTGSNLDTDAVGRNCSNNPD